MFERGLSAVTHVDSERATMNQDFDIDICGLLGALTLKGGPDGMQPAPTQNEIPPLNGPVSQDYSPSPRAGSEIRQGPDDALMEIIDSEGNVQFIQGKAPSSSGPRPSVSHSPTCCALLRELCDRMEWHTGRTSSADFLEAILTHRESFMAFPPGHRGCSAAFTQLAFMLERRGHENHADGDIDTAIALHNEAWLTAGWA